MSPNPANFARLIACLESDWAQKQPVHSLTLLWRLIDKDNALSIQNWLGVDWKTAKVIFDMLVAEHLDDRHNFKRRAAALRGFCERHNIQLEERAA